MRLKWDQGLASRGKLRGKKTFPGEILTDESPNHLAIAEVRWAADADAVPHKRRKKSHKVCVSELDTQVVSALESPSDHREKRSSSLTLASICPQIPQVNISPKAPVPQILFHGNNAQLFQHYLHHVAKVTVVADTDKNPFKTIIMPMSFESPLIMSNILAIAAANISHTYPEYGVLVYSHLSNAYSELNQRLSQPATRFSEVTLAGILGQVSFQLHHGDAANWRVHLNAARNIVK